MGHPLPGAGEAHRERRSWEGDSSTLLRPRRASLGPRFRTPRFSRCGHSRSVVGFIAREAVLALGRRHPELLVEANRRLAKGQSRLARRLLDLAYASARRRLVRVLLELGQEHGAPERGGVRIDVPLSLRDVAEMIGASRQTASEELQPLARQGLVKVVWPTFFLPDPQGLQRPR